MIALQVAMEMMPAGCWECTFGTAEFIPKCRIKNAFNGDEIPSGYYPDREIRGGAKGGLLCPLVEVAEIVEAVEVDNDSN